MDMFSKRKLLCKLVAMNFLLFGCFSVSGATEFGGIQAGTGISVSSIRYSDGSVYTISLKDGISTSIGSTHDKGLATAGAVFDYVKSELGTNNGGNYYSSVDTVSKAMEKLDKQLATLHNTKVAVANGTDSISIGIETDATTGEITYTLSVDTSKVEDNDSGLLTSKNAYNELRTGANGTYISAGNTTATNLKKLDTKIGAAKGVSGLYGASADVESQIQAVGNKTIQSMTNAVSNSASDTQKITVKTYDGTTTNIEIAGQGAVTSGDVRLLNGNTVYTELRPTDGNYVMQANTTAANLLALDTKIGAKKGVTGLYDEAADVESQIQAVGNKTIQSITNAVSNGASDTQKITVKTYDGTTTNIEIAGQGTVASGDVRILNGDTIYNELRPADGNYIKQSNTTADNLTALDTQVKINENNIRDLTGEVHQIGAGAAALAALRPEPYDPDDRWSFAAGYGHYKNGNAAALGVFFKPDDDTTFSFGSTVWSGDPMINFGASFKLGSRGINTIPRTSVELFQELAALRQSNEKLLSDNMMMLKEDNAALAKRIEILEADNEKIKSQVEKILAEMAM